MFVRASRWPFLSPDVVFSALVFALLAARPAVDPDLLAVLFALAVRERELLDPFARDRLLALFELPFREVALLELPLRELGPDPFVPFLDVEREVEVSVRFA